MHSTSPPAKIGLRVDAFTAWTSEQGLENAGAAGERLGIDRSTVARIVAGKIRPGEQFIAAVLAATEKPFEDFFEIAEAS